MQTFVPSPIFHACAQVLDRKRLGKQRVETLQIAKVIAGETNGWSTHPAVAMWRGKPEALMAYQTAICNHWTSFNYRDTCLEKTAAVLGLSPLSQFSLDVDMLPPWLGREDVHLSHRSNLLRKLPDHYRQFWPDEPDDLPYVWPAA